jgi:hypothetical protein
MNTTSLVCGYDKYDNVITGKSKSAICIMKNDRVIYCTTKTWKVKISLLLMRLFGIIIVRDVPCVNWKSFSFKIRKCRVFDCSYSSGIGFFRLFGKGLSWKDTTRYRLYFSERNNLYPALTIFNYRVSAI